MRFKRATILAGAAALLAATAASAEVHRMNVALPDGSVAHVEYEGEVAPTVTVVPSVMPARIAFDPFAGFERIAAMMEARHRAMMMQIAALRHAAARAAAAAPGETILAGTLPEGVHYTMVSSTTDASGCTRTVRYSSDGSGAAPQVTRASAGTCDAAPDKQATIPASATPVPQEQAPGLEV